VPYTLLELGKVGRAESIGLGNNGNEVDSRAQTLHDLNIQRLQGVTSRADEVKAGVDTKIDLVLTARLLLLQHVGLMLIIQELDDGHPRVAVVDVVTETGSVDNGEADCHKSATASRTYSDRKLTLEELLLQLSLGNLDLYGLVDLLLVPALVVGIVLDRSGEKGVDEGRLAQARLASNLNTD